MSEARETNPQFASHIKSVLKESGLEVHNLRREDQQAAYGDSIHDAREYVATVNGETIGFFVKIFQDISRERAELCVQNELRATEKLNKLSPGFTYEVIGYSIVENNDPMLITKTIDSLPLTSQFEGDAEKEIPIIVNTLQVLSFVHKAGIIHGDTFPRNFLVADIGGIIPIDFEKAEFREDLNLRDFQRLKKEDVIRFLTAIYPLFQKQHEDLEWKKHIKEYYEFQEDEIVKTLKSLYDENFARDIQRELKGYLSDLLSF